MTSMVLNVTFDCGDPAALARFWGEVTGWPVDEEPEPGRSDASVGPAADGGPRLYFVHVVEPKPAKNRLHLDVMPSDRTQNEEIERLIGLGATVLSDRRPEFGWVVLADPQGNEFCLEISRGELDALIAAEHDRLG
jgi:predicted enzyme related to lactoylglutathione lyase